MKMHRKMPLNSDIRNYSDRKETRYIPISLLGIAKKTLVSLRNILLMDIPQKKKINDRCNLRGFYFSCFIKTNKFFEKFVVFYKKNLLQCST